MLPVDILLKCITLLHREDELDTNATDKSIDLVRTILDVIAINENKLYGGDTDILVNMKHLVTDMCDNPGAYDKLNLLQSLELILKDKQDLIKIVDKTINADISDPALKRTIISLRNTLNNYYKEQQIKSTISKASYEIMTGKLGNKSLQEYGNILLTNLESLLMTTKTKDPGIVNELDVGDEDGMGKILNKVKNNSEDGGKLICGWKEINEMTQGGFMRHETVIINALQHKYKSGFTQSLFMQLAKLNVPDMDDVNKKPLMLYISFEDDVEVITEFMYRYLYYNENQELPDLTTVTGKEIAAYIKERLSVSGYHVKILRINPNEWTFKHMFNKILEYEADGYEIHACFVDYLAKLPTTGCTITGPGGTDVRDLFDRCRNFFGS